MRCVRLAGRADFPARTQQPTCRLWASFAEICRLDAKRIGATGSTSSLVLVLVATDTLGVFRARGIEGVTSLFFAGLFDGAGTGMLPCLWSVSRLR